MKHQSFNKNIATIYLTLFTRDVLTALHGFSHFLLTYFSHQFHFQIRKCFSQGNFRVLNVKHVLIDRVQIGTKIFSEFVSCVTHCVIVS